MARFKRKRANIKTDINFVNHFLEGSVFEYKSKSSDAVYELTVGHAGPYCDCPGFAFNGNCTHIKTFIKDLEAV